MSAGRRASFMQGANVPRDRQRLWGDVPSRLGWALLGVVWLAILTYIFYPR
jgi:hypothetical protein